MDLIETDVARAQFEALDRDTVTLLCDAIQSDFAEWSEALVAGWAERDDEAIRRARHALKGLSGNFGAVALETMAGSDLSLPQDAERFRRCVTDTVAAIIAAAGTGS